MDSETWLEKAERLRGDLRRVGARQLDEEERAAMERMVIALWLRSEFRPENEPLEFPRDISES